MKPTRNKSIEFRVNNILIFFYVLQILAVRQILAFEPPYRLTGINANSLALGGAALNLKKPLAAVFSNPAGFPGLKEKMEVNAERLYTYERRLRNDGTSAANARTNYSIPQGAFAVSTGKIGFGAGYSAAMDFGYEFRDNAARDRGWGSSEGMDSVEVTGSFNQIGVGLGFAPHPNFSLGATYLRGNGAREEKITLLSVKGQDINKLWTKTEQNLSGDTFLAGITVEPKRHISLSFTYTNGFDINAASQSFKNGEKVAELEYKHFHPPVYGIGIEHKIGGMSLFYGADYIPSSGLSRGANYADSYYLKTGISLPADEKTKIMSGFFIGTEFNFPINLFTLGFEHLLDKSSIGGALAFGQSEPSNRPRIFPIKPGDSEHAATKFLKILFTVSLY